MFTNNVTPGEFRIYHVLRFLPATGDVILTARDLRVVEVVDLWDALFDEFEVMRNDYAGIFQSSIDPTDAALFAHWQSVIGRADCGPPRFPLMNSTVLPFVLSARFQCPVPAGEKIGDRADLFVGFERIGD